MAFYRKKPVVVEAVKLTYDNIDEVKALLESGTRLFCTGLCRVKIWTLEGIMEARPGDYIIKGVNGECYPCKPDIFAKTYEEVNE